MLKAIRASSRYDILDTPMNAAGSNYVIKEIRGLGPLKSEIATSEFALFGWGMVHHTRPVMRNIVIKYGLRPTPSPYQNWGTSVTLLRRRLSKVFPPGEDIELRIESDEVPYRFITAWVESVEDDMFSKEPQIEVSLLCPDPYFHEPFETFTISSGLPFPYEGDVPTPLILTMKPAAQITNFSVNLVGGSQIESLTFNGVVAANDSIRIESTPGHKYVDRINGTTGVYTNALRYLDAASDWITLKPGYNTINFSAIPATNYLFTAAWRKLYGSM